MYKDRKLSIFPWRHVGVIKAYLGTFYAYLGAWERITFTLHIQYAFLNAP